MQTILEPGRAEKNYWRDLWRYRELFHGYLKGMDIGVDHSRPLFE